MSQRQIAEGNQPVVAHGAAVAQQSPTYPLPIQIAVAGTVQPVETSAV
ncbi:hypothetical protein [Paracoccus mutanolyticus]|nr:hypothetical protein [Paracoccus mutanolyticus]